jgi:hypothetical protein
MNKIGLEEHRKYNAQRCKKLIWLKAENFKMKKSIEKYIRKHELSNTDSDFVRSFVHSLGKCSDYSLFSEVNGEIKYMASVTCNHKLCNICNWNRQKRVRRKYINWFSQNETINKTTKGKDIKYVTNSNLNKYLQNGYELSVSGLKYDLMHLTLTVPHTKEHGWRGKTFYYSEIMQSFNYMRKYDDWKNNVYGGEYGVETSKNNNGYHIHIHALLFVRKEIQSRNKLHLSVLRHWNSLTVDSNSQFHELDKNRSASIKRGNKLITDEYLKGLNPKGATSTSLETIYTVKNGIKSRSQEWNSDAMIIAVLETISYHFKPLIFKEGASIYDIETIIEVLPAIYGKTLYRKFGCLHGEKSLNAKDNSLLDDYAETSEEYDEETGEVFQPHYFSTNPLNMYVKESENKICIHRNREIKSMGAKSGKEAINELINYTIK